MEQIYVEKSYIIAKILDLKEKIFNEKYVKIKELNCVCSILQDEFEKINGLIIGDIDLLSFTVMEEIIFYNPKSNCSLIDYSNLDRLPFCISKILSDDTLLSRVLLENRKDEYNNLYNNTHNDKKNVPPRSIVLDGGDGTGKSTQTKLLKEHLEKDGIELVYHHFPTYNSFQGVPVEHYLNGDFGNLKDLSPYFINTLYAVDRAITWNTILKPEYDKGKTVLFDRYTTSSIIYQSSMIENISEKKDFINYVIDYEYNKLGLIEPDLVIYLYLPFDVGRRLLESRKSNDGVVNDLHERDLDFLRRVTDNALFVSDYLGWSKIDCSCGDNIRSIDDIHNDIYRLIKK